MTTMMFYRDLVALNDKRHADLRLQAVARYDFVAGTASLPLLMAESGECARRYPLVFAGPPGAAVPAILLGLQDGENLFVDARGQWTGAYLPAFIRRYPFALGNDEAGNAVVCIDQAATCLGTAAGEPLFIAGQPGPVLQKTMNFLREFQAAALATAQVAARIEALGLLRAADSLAKLKDGSQFRLSGLRVVDAARLAALDDAALLDLARSGGLKLIHAHLISLGNLATLVDKLSARRAERARPAAKTRAAATG